MAGRLFAARAAGCESGTRFRPGRPSGCVGIGVFCHRQSGAGRLHFRGVSVNIFFLDRDPGTAARLHSDQHVVKMVLETAQILCAVLFRHGIAAPYKPTHARHPCVLWTGDSLSHWRWVRRLGLELGAEYTYRRDRVHASAAVIAALPESPAIPDLGWRDPPQAMPDAYRGADAVAAYRAYYAAEKSHFAGKGPATWTRRPRPAFMTEGGDGVR